MANQWFVIYLPWAFSLSLRFSTSRDKRLTESIELGRFDNEDPVAASSQVSALIGMFFMLWSVRYPRALWLVFLPSSDLIGMFFMLWCSCSSSFHRSFLPSSDLFGMLFKPWSVRSPSSVRYVLQALIGRFLKLWSVCSTNQKLMLPTIMFTVQRMSHCYFRSHSLTFPLNCSYFWKKTPTMIAKKKWYSTAYAGYAYRLLTPLKCWYFSAFCPFCSLLIRCRIIFRLSFGFLSAFFRSSDS